MSVQSGFISVITMITFLFLIALVLRSYLKFQQEKLKGSNDSHTRYFD